MVPDIDAAAVLSNAIAPEHLELIGVPAGRFGLFKNYGALFLERLSGEVIGDYGIGPNHTLPTGGSARYTGGLSVFTFLKVRTWLRLDDPEGSRGAYGDSVKLARIEGLEAHARSALKRL